MNGLGPLVVFRLAEQRYALPLPMVERIVRAAEVTPLPQAPAVVYGAIDIAGHIIPVLDVRRRLGLATRAITPSDQFLIARLAQRKVVLVIDEAQGVVQRPPGDTLAAAAIVPGLEHIEGVVRLDDGLVLIQNLEKFLSLDEAQALDRALSEAAPHAH
jgi:purine-binding chemotaxis protein CheW